MNTDTKGAATVEAAFIFGDGDEECEALAPFGPVMKLEGVVEACGSA